MKALENPRLGEGFSLECILFSAAIRRKRLSAASQISHAGSAVTMAILSRLFRHQASTAEDLGDPVLTSFLAFLYILCRENPRRCVRSCGVAIDLNRIRGKLNANLPFFDIGLSL